MTYNDEPVPEAYWRGVHVGLLWGCVASLTLPFLIDYAFFHTWHTDRVLTRPSVYQAIRLVFPEQEAAGRLAPAAAPAAGVEMVNLLEQGPVAPVGVPHAMGLEPVVVEVPCTMHISNHSSRQLRQIFAANADRTD